MTSVADFNSEFSLRAALRQAQFPEHAIDAALEALFPVEPDPDESIYEAPAFEPSEEDWHSYCEWCEDLELRREDEAEARRIIDAADRLADARRDERLRELQAGRWD